MCAAVRALDKILTRLQRGGKVRWKVVSSEGEASGFSSGGGGHGNIEVSSSKNSLRRESRHSKPRLEGFCVCRCVFIFYKATKILFSHLIKAKQRGGTAARRSCAFPNAAAYRACKWCIHFLNHRREPQETWRQPHLELPRLYAWSHVTRREFHPSLPVSHLKSYAYGAAARPRAPAWRRRLQDLLCVNSTSFVSVLCEGSEWGV